MDKVTGKLSVSEIREKVSPLVIELFLNLLDHKCIVSLAYCLFNFLLPKIRNFYLTAYLQKASAEIVEF